MPPTTRLRSWRDVPSRVRNLRGTRWILRGAYAAPLIAFALRLSADGFHSTENAALIERGRAVVWGSRSLGFVATSYPPIPTAIAKLIPNATTLAVMGALAAGVVLETVHHQVRKTGAPIHLTVLLVALLALSPGFAVTATANLTSFLAVALIAVALEGFLRFAHLGQTHGGFQAGLALGFACLCQPAAIICALALAASAPLIARHRYQGRRAAGRATASVLLFPTFAGLIGWTFLCWRFAGAPLVWLHTSAPTLFELGNVVDAALRVEHEIAAALTVIPLLIAVAVLVARHSGLLPATALFVPPLALAGAAAFGLGLGAGATAAVIGLIALTSLPARLPRRELLAVIAFAMLSLAIKITVVTNTLVTMR